MSLAQCRVRRRTQVTSSAAIYTVSGRADVDGRHRMRMVFVMPRHIIGLMAEISRVTIQRSPPSQKRHDQKQPQSTKPMPIEYQTSREKRRCQSVRRHTS